MIPLNDLAFRHWAFVISAHKTLMVSCTRNGPSVCNENSEEGPLLPEVVAEAWRSPGEGCCWVWERGLELTAVPPSPAPVSPRPAAPSAPAAGPSRGPPPGAPTAARWRCSPAATRRGRVPAPPPWPMWRTGTSRAPPTRTRAPRPLRRAAPTRCSRWRSGTRWPCGAGMWSATPAPFAGCRSWVSACRQGPARHGRRLRRWAEGARPDNRRCPAAALRRATRLPARCGRAPPSPFRARPAARAVPASWGALRSEGPGRARAAVRAHLTEASPARWAAPVWAGAVSQGAARPARCRLRGLCGCVGGGVAGAVRCGWRTCRGCSAAACACFEAVLWAYREIRFCLS